MPPTDTSLPTRRTLFRFLAAGTAAAALPGLAGHPGRAAGRRVVIVVLGGGVRPQDSVEHADAMPALKKLAAEGTHFTNVKSSGKEPLAALRAILTGVSEDAPAGPAAATPPPPAPTLFECLRRDGGAQASDAWFVAAGDGALRAAATSAHPEFGAAYAPATLAIGPMFSVAQEAALKALDPSAGDADPAKRDELLRALGRGRNPEGAAPPDAAARAVEEWLVDERALAAAEPDHGRSDRRALRGARRLLLAVKPRVLVVALADAAVAERSAAAQAAVLKADDALLGELAATIAADAELRETTALLVLPDLGRNRRASPDGALRRDETGPDPAKIFLVAAGAGIKGNQTVKSAVNSFDVAPTAAHLLGVKMPLAKGKILRAALA